MTRFAVALCVAGLTLSGCGGSTNSSEDQGPGVPTTRPGNPPSASAARLAAGFDISAICDSSMSQTKVLLVAIWQKANTQWQVSVREVTANLDVLRESNLVGRFVDPSFSSGIMILQDADGTDVGRLVQTDANKARFDEVGRILNDCVLTSATPVPDELR